MKILALILLAPFVLLIVIFVLLPFAIIDLVVECVEYLVKIIGGGE